MTGVAIVGCAHIHTPKFVDLLRHRTDIDVLAVWDHDGDRSSRVASQLGAATVSDVAAIWANSRVEAVIICSETIRHPDLVRGAVRASKHLFVEKPLAITGVEAQALAALIDGSGLVYSTGFFMRGRGVYRHLRDQIDAGTLGRLTRIDISIAHAGALAGWFDEWGWMADADQAGYGGFGDLGIHAVDLVLWLLGYRKLPQRVSAWTGTASGRYGTVDEFGRGQLGFADGMVASLWASWVDLANPAELVVSGTDAYASIIGGRLSYRRGLGDEAVETEASDVPSDLPHAFELFLGAINGDRSPALVAPVEAARCTTIIETLYRAAGVGGWVTIGQD